CDRRCDRDRGMRGSGVFDGGCAAVLSAAQDEIRRPAGDAQVALGVDFADVAHAHPAVTGEQLVVVGAPEIPEAGCGTATSGLTLAWLGDVLVDGEQGS